MAGYTGCPVFLSHTMVVSRWFVIPIAAMSSAEAPIFVMASLATASWVDQISPGSCSTHPGFGKCCVNSFWATLHISPLSLNRMQRLLVVPESRAITYFAILFSSFVYIYCMMAQNRSLIFGKYSISAFPMIFFFATNL